MLDTGVHPRDFGIFCTRSRSCFFVFVFFVFTTQIQVTVFPLQGKWSLSVHGKAPSTLSARRSIGKTGPVYALGSFDAAGDRIWWCPMPEEGRAPPYHTIHWHHTLPRIVERGRALGPRIEFLHNQGLTSARTPPTAAVQALYLINTCFRFGAATTSRQLIPFQLSAFWPG